ncbi:hypothetical protein VCHC52A1_3784, partial [Vibrio cholerae HC-52A1]
MEVDV